MLMCRKDVTISNKKVTCKNSSHIGFSSTTLKRGDFFVYSDDGQLKLGKMHHHIEHDPNGEANGWIVAQIASACMTYTMERWVVPSTVTEVIPSDRMQQHIRDHFVDREIQQPVFK